MLSTTSLLEWKWAGDSHKHRSHPPNHQVFAQLRLPYSVKGHHRFYERAEVQDLIAYFRLSVHPNNNLSFQRVVNVPMRGFGSAALKALIRAANDTQRSQFEELAYQLQTRSCPFGLNRTSAAKMQDFVALVREMHSLVASNRPLHFIFEEVVRRVQYEDYICRKVLNKVELKVARKDAKVLDRMGNVEELIAQVKDFDMTYDRQRAADDVEAAVAAAEAAAMGGGATAPGATAPGATAAGAGAPQFAAAALLSADGGAAEHRAVQQQQPGQPGQQQEEQQQSRAAAFEADVLANALAESNSEEEESVTISTVHKAKGLEWLFVFVPGCDDSIFPTLWGDADQEEYVRKVIEEERRLLYVAMTRAKYGLELLTARSRFQRPLQLSRYLKPSKVRACFDTEPPKEDVWQATRNVLVAMSRSTSSTKLATVLETVTQKLPAVCILFWGRDC